MMSICFLRAERVFLYSAFVMPSFEEILFASFLVSAEDALTEGSHFARSETGLFSFMSAISVSSWDFIRLKTSFAQGVLIRQRRSSYLPYSAKKGIFLLTASGLS